MKFETRDAVADVDERRAGVFLNYAGAIFNGFQNDDALSFGKLTVAAVDQIIKTACAVFVFIESFRTRIEHTLDVFGNCLSFGAHSLDRFADAHRIPRFENADFPPEAP